MKRWVTPAATRSTAGRAGALGLLEQAPRLGLHWSLLLMPGGKTIVGGPLGGWLTVELVKRVSGIHSRTGDLFAAPLCVGIAIGRIGCFLAGLADDTYGKATGLPWGIDFGDGVRRHPTQLYEVFFLIMLAWALVRWQALPHREGELFRRFLATYLAWRFLIDFLKPQPLVLGLNMIQWACTLGLAILATNMLQSSLAAKTIAVSVVGILVALGLCGLAPGTANAILREIMTVAGLLALAGLFAGVISAIFGKWS